MRERDVVQNERFFEVFKELVPIVRMARTAAAETWKVDLDFIEDIRLKEEWQWKTDRRFKDMAKCTAGYLSDYRMVGFNLTKLRQWLPEHTSREQLVTSIGWLLVHECIIHGSCKITTIEGEWKDHLEEGLSVLGEGSECIRKLHRKNPLQIKQIGASVRYFLGDEAVIPVGAKIDEAIAAYLTLYTAIPVFRFVLDENRDWNRYLLEEGIVLGGLLTAEDLIPVIEFYKDRDPRIHFPYYFDGRFFDQYAFRLPEEQAIEVMAHLFLNDPSLFFEKLAAHNPA